MKQYFFQKWKTLPKYQKYGLPVLILAAVAATLLCLRKEDIGTDKAVEELRQFSQNIRRFYQNRPDYWGLNTQTAVDKQIYPLRMLKDGTPKSHYGTPVLAGSGPNGDILMPGARNFDIIYKDLNRRQCIELSSYKFDEKFWLGISSVSIINDGGETQFGWSGTQTLPIAEDAAEKFCKGQNILIWHYE